MVHAFAISQNELCAGVHQLFRLSFTKSGCFGGNVDFHGLTQISPTKEKNKLF